MRKFEIIQVGKKYFIEEVSEYRDLFFCKNILRCRVSEKKHYDTYVDVEFKSVEDAIDYINENYRPGMVVKTIEI